MKPLAALLFIFSTFPAWADAPDPGAGASLQPIPGPLYKTPGACRKDAGNSVVVVNGATYCKRPTKAVSHNSSRSNFSTSTAKKKTGGK